MLSKRDTGLGFFDFGIIKVCESSSRDVQHKSTILKSTATRVGYRVSDIHGPLSYSTVTRCRFALVTPP